MLPLGDMGSLLSCLRKDKQESYNLCLGMTVGGVYLTVILLSPG